MGKKDGWWKEKEEERDEKTRTSDCRLGQSAIFTAPRSRGQHKSLADANIPQCPPPNHPPHPHPHPPRLLLRGLFITAEALYKRAAGPLPPPTSHFFLCCNTHTFRLSTLISGPCVAALAPAMGSVGCVGGGSQRLMLFYWLKKKKQQRAAKSLLKKTNSK